MEEYIEKTLLSLDDKDNKHIKNEMILDNVVIDGRSTGLLGRVFLKFVMVNCGELQFENDVEFQIGDTVGFRTTQISKSNYEIIGQIYKIKSNKIIISIDCDDPTIFTSFGKPYKWVQDEYSSIKFSIDKLNNHENKNQNNDKQIKETIKSLSSNNYNKFISLFDGTHTLFKNSESVLNNLELELSNNNNDILSINNSNNTCKIKTITEIINHINKSNSNNSNNNKILVFSSSNDSIDFICNSLLDNGINNITKIGNSTLDSNINKITLEYKIKHSEGGNSIKQIKQDIIKSCNNVLDSKKSDSNSSKSNIIQLKKDLNNLEIKLINKTINDSKIILSSSTYSIDKYLNDKNDFDYIIIDHEDELSNKNQLNLNCWLPILKSKKVIIVRG